MVPPVQVVLRAAARANVLVVALAFGLWLAALNVRYRDISNVVPFIVLVGLFITPIIYPFSQVPEAYQPLYGLNPMVGVMELMRWMVLPGSVFPVWLSSSRSSVDRPARDGADVLRPRRAQLRRLI